MCVLRYSDLSRKLDRSFRFVELGVGELKASGSFEKVGLCALRVCSVALTTFPATTPLKDPSICFPWRDMPHLIWQSTVEHRAKAKGVGVLRGFLLLCWQQLISNSL